MLSAIKKSVAGMFPKMYQRAQTALERYRLRRVSHFLARQYGLVVLSGPFRGMKYLSEAACSSLTPKLLGSYEGELHGALNEIIATKYDKVVNIGCAEGFYAVGLALQLKATMVYAFDIDPHARELCNNLAAVNEVRERVLVDGECNHQNLQRLTGGRVLIVSDCEGSELGLLDPALAPGLKTSDLLVELHDMFDARITPTLMTRFAPTHEISLIDATERDPRLFPALKNFSPATQRTALAEFRDAQMQWAWMRARNGTGQALQSDS